MRQTAPDPILLEGLIKHLDYKAGWSFDLEDMDRGQGSEGLTLVITVDSADSYHPERNIKVLHYMIVPPAAYDERAWCRWILDQILQVEQHETCEFFKIGGERPYAPNHGPGRNPYTITDQGTPEDARTDSCGVRYDAGG